MNILSEIAVITMGTNEVADVIGVFTTHFNGLLKWSYCTIKNRRLFDLILKLEKCHVLCQRIDSTKEGSELYESKIGSARQHSNFFFLWWLFMCVFTVIQWCVIPLLLGTYKSYLINDTFTDRDLPYIAWFPLDIQNNFNYIFLYLVQTIGMLTCAFGIVCYDSFYVSMLIAICTQIQYINTILAKTDFIENTRVPEVVFILKKKLRNCVDCHVEIIEFLEKLQIFTSPVMFAQCIITLFIICLVSFEVSAVKFTLDKENAFALFKLFGYFLAAALQLYFFCFYATQITYLALQIPHSVYSCGWEIIIFEEKKESSTKKQFQYSDISRLVQMITIQAQRPIVLTGGPFYILSMETFRAIISMALSNSIMLRQLSDSG
ncbi:odorant receptor 33b-like [Odontomachus brunneus]|uniref:odorant receptor 33b-like n=1 Tax=Odontomachus brunneus TaxID=486640 RepID=UPI0013F29710|nr:odorant receptor 33b-like [Odontomachus brunneus]